MKIHEYQSKEILRKFNVAVPRGGVAFTAQEAYEIAKVLETPKIVVKAQIHAGGRGKGGGVKLANSPEEAKEIAYKRTKEYAKRQMTWFKKDSEIQWFHPHRDSERIEQTIDYFIGY